MRPPATSPATGRQPDARATPPPAEGVGDSYDSAPPATARLRGPGRVTWLVAAVVVGVAVLAAALAYGGGTGAAALPGLPGPGRLTGWGLPVLRLLLDVTGMTTVGVLLAVGVLLPPGPAGLGARSQELLRRASGIAALWAAGAVVSVAFTFSDFLGVPLGSALDPGQLASFVTEVSQGRALALQGVVAATIAFAARWQRHRGGPLALLVLALVGVVLPGATGHSGAATDHMLAESSLVVHVGAASLWVGGLIALGVLATHGPRAMAVAVPRFSRLALWCVIAVGASGVVNAAVRLGSVAEVTGSTYGRLVLAKVAALVALTAFGAWHRRRTLPALSSDGAWAGFARVAAAETILMVGTVALAVGLSRSPTPVPGDAAAGAFSRTRDLLGYPMPARPTPWRLLADVRIDGFLLTGALLGAALYLTGAAVMRRRGDRWPVGRTLAWLAGIAVLVVSTSGGLGRYSSVLFSAHMTQHMILNMAVPILLVLGAPLTLALRTLTPASRGGTGAREALLRILHSRAVLILTNPIVAAVIFVGSLYGLYFSPVFPAAMSNHWGHLAMEVHFIAAGLLFFWVLVGIDPGPRRPPHLARLVLLFAVMATHAFFSVALMSSNSVLAASWFGSLQRPWGASLLEDQQLGGGIGWAFGEVPVIAVVAALIVSWVRTDEREAARADRRADADGDAALAAYNARFAALAAADAAASSRHDHARMVPPAVPVSEEPTATGALGDVRRDRAPVTSEICRDTQPPPDLETS